MAEADKTVVENTATPEPAKKGSNKMLLFGGIGLGAVVIGVVLALFVIKPMMADSSDGSEGDGTEQTETTKKVSKKEKQKLVNEEGQEVSSLIYAMENIVINPSGTGGSRFLSVSFGFELESMELQEEFSQKEPIIRDALITILSSKTVAELTDAKQKEIVRFQIKKRLSKLMHTEDLAGVYYTDFVLQ